MDGGVMAKTLKWVVLQGGFSGDGSQHHQLYRLEQDRVPFFVSKQDAMDHAASKGQHAIIAEVSVYVEPMVAMLDAETGKEIS
jgi:hypothetical protein